MKLMTGEIGKLSLDSQVGGFRNWRVVIDRTTNKAEVYTTSYWMLEKIDTKNLKASFYAELDNRLKLIQEGEVEINLPPDCPIGVNIKTPLKMTFKEGFDWQKSIQSK